MSEPIHRNTAPSVAWTNHRITHQNPNANIIVTPSDQFVQNEEAFRQNVMEGFDFVEHNDTLLTMGVKPTRPEPGYGYIQLGEPVGHDLYKVQSFTEKPEREFAKMFMESGEFYWNTGLFLSNVRHLTKAFIELLPMVLRNLDVVKPDYTIEEELAFVNENFPSYPNLSIDYGILEKSENVHVMKCDFGWADIGTWHSIYESMQKSEDDNVVIDSDVMLDECKGNVIKLPKGKLAVINGLEGYIVAEKDNVLFICKKEDSSALVRKYVNEVQLKKGDEYV
jgi:mannose-1-phosphate guanylyltransferase